MHPDEQPHDGMIEILPDPFEETGTSTSNAFHMLASIFERLESFFMRVLNIIFFQSQNIISYKAEDSSKLFWQPHTIMSFGKVQVLEGVR